MSVLLDLIVIAIIGICVLISAREGFIKALISVVGFILVVMLANSVSTPLAEATYTKTIEKAVVDKIEDIDVAVDDNVDTSFAKVWDELPDFVSKSAENLGFSKENFLNNITENLSQGATNAVKVAMNNTVKPVFINILKLLYAIVIISVLSVVVGFVARFVNKLFSFGIIKSLNRFLGGILGLPKGIIIAVIFCVAITLISDISGGFWIFTPKNITNTILFKFLGKIISLNEILSF